jgi:hypothetical protein
VDTISSTIKEKTMSEKIQQIAAAIGISVVSITGTFLYIDGEQVPDIVVEQPVAPLEVSATCDTEQPVVVNEKLQYKFTCVTSDNKEYKSALYSVEPMEIDKLTEAEITQMNNWVNIVVDQSNNDTPQDEQIP